MTGRRRMPNGVESARGGNRPMELKPASDRRRYTMLRKTLLTLAASALLGAVAVASNSADAFGPPPLPGIGGPPAIGGLGGPPHLPGPGGLPPHLGGLPRLGPGGPPHGRLGGPPGLSRRGGTGGRSRHAGSNGSRAGRHADSGYDRSGRHHRGRYYGDYGYGYSSDDDSYSDGACYYTYSHGRRTRAVVCDED